MGAECSLVLKSKGSRNELSAYCLGLGKLLCYGMGRYGGDIVKRWVWVIESIKVCRYGLIT